MILTSHMMMYTRRKLAFNMSHQIQKSLATEMSCEGRQIFGDIPNDTICYFTGFLALCVSLLWSSDSWKIEVIKKKEHHYLRFKHTA